MHAHTLAKQMQGSKSGSSLISQGQQVQDTISGATESIHDCDGILKSLRQGIRKQSISAKSSRSVMMQSFNRGSVERYNQQGIVSTQLNSKLAAVPIRTTSLKTAQECKKITIDNTIVETVSALDSCHSKVCATLELYMFMCTLYKWQSSCLLLHAVPFWS